VAQTLGVVLDRIAMMRRNVVRLKKSADHRAGFSAGAGGRLAR
jgi:hypothetical protein